MGASEPNFIYNERDEKVSFEPIFCLEWGQEEKGTTEEEMAGWHHPLDGQEFG